MSKTTTEERLAVLEKEVAELKRQLGSVWGSDDWLTAVSGSLKDEPDFAEVLELGRRLRQSDQPEPED